MDGIGSSGGSRGTIKKEDGLHAVSINIFHEQLGRHDMFFLRFVTSKDVRQDGSRKAGS